MRSAGALMTRTRRRVRVPSGFVPTLAVVAPRVRVLAIAAGAGLAVVAVLLEVGLLGMEISPVVRGGGPSRPRRPPRRGGTGQAIRRRPRAAGPSARSGGR